MMLWFIIIIGIIGLIFGDEKCDIKVDQETHTELCSGMAPFCCGALDSRHCCSFAQQILYYSLMVAILGMVVAIVLSAAVVCKRAIKEPPTDVNEHKIETSINRSNMSQI